MKEEAQLNPCLEHGQKGNSGGYAGIWIYKRDGSRFKVGLHRKVYCDYNNVSLESIKGLVVRHKCDNPRCINPEHLEIGTHKDNSQDAINRNRVSRGEKHGDIPESVIILIRKLYVPRSQYNYYTLGKIFNISPSHVCRIVKYKKRGKL